MVFKRQHLLDSDKAMNSEVHRAPSIPSISSFQNDLTANQRRVLSMQRLHGNHAVLRMLARSRGTVAQRAPQPQVGWETRGGNPTKGPNQGETQIPPDSTSTKPGSARRIPIRGLGHGTTLDDPDAKDWLDRTASSQTKETASGRQAIVVIPEKLDVNQEVAVLFHIHGKTIGYRNSGGKVEDVDFARIEQQLQASGLNMIAILPQGALRDVARSCPDFGSVDRENLINDVFTFLNDNKVWTSTPSAKDVKPKRGRLVLSTHSCGGFKGTPMLEEDVSAKNLKTGNINPANMAGVFLFDSIHNKTQSKQVTDWLNAQMNHDLSELKAIADRSTTPKDEQLKYLKSSMQFRGIYSHTDNDVYVKAYAPVNTALNDWFNTNKDQINKVMSPDVLSVFKNNYQVIDSGHADHMRVMSNNDQLKQALGALNLPAIGSTTATQTTGAPKASGTVPGAGSASGSANAQKTTIDDGIQRQPAPDASGGIGAKGPNAVLPTQTSMDATIQLAQRVPNIQRWKEPGIDSDVGGPPPNYAAPPAPRLSGRAWYDDFPTSVSTDDLTEPFKTSAELFLKALTDAGATYTINATYRPPQRAYLMHYAYAIARNGMNPASVPAYDGPGDAVNIEWVHRDAAGKVDRAASKAAAEEMVVAYDMAYTAALRSRHTEGHAMDIDISWDGDLSIKNASGRNVVIKTTPRNGAGNTQLHAVGKTYGVIKHKTDRPHWSTDGN